VPHFDVPSDPRSPAVRSIIHAIIFELLEQAHRELCIPDAGHVGVGGFSYDAPEIALRAVRRMLRTALHLAGYDFGSQAVPQLQAFVSLLYEGRPNGGRLVIAPEGDPAVTVEVGLADPVPLRDKRHLRKLLEPTGAGMAQLMRDRDVYGLGTITDADTSSPGKISEITIGSSGTWHLSQAATRVLTVQDALPKLPHPQLDYSLLEDTITRTLQGADLSRLKDLASAASRNRHGAMLIISSDAEAEASRLAPQATKTVPRPLAPQAMQQLTNMDGGVLIDPHGHCHAIGVILDGTAAGNGDPARGSRYNNAVRYLSSNSPPAVVLSCSSDGDITILPTLKPRRRQAEIETALAGAGEVDVQAAAGGADAGGSIVEQPGIAEPGQGGEAGARRAAVVDVQHVGPGVAGDDGDVAAGVAGEPFAELGGVGAGVEVAVRGGGGFPAGLAGEHRPAELGAGQRRAQDLIRHRALRCQAGLCPQRAVSAASWAARAGRMRTWYSAWAESRRAVRAGCR
jgi:hypothetical protein